MAVGLAAADEETVARVAAAGGEALARKMAAAHGPRNAEMRALRAAGWTYQKIADRYGLKRQRIGQILGPE